MTLQIGLTTAQLLERRNGIGGSDANVIMSGDQERILRLWEEKTGRREPEDLSRVLPVQMGSFTEPLNRHWYTMTTGNDVADVGAIVQHPSVDFMRCTLDGTVSAEGAIFEAKHVNQFSKIDAVAQKYMPQLHHNMSCAGLSRAILSSFIGTMTYEHVVVESDPFYLATLIDAEQVFWAHVQNGTPPGDMPAPIAPTPPALLRKVDMAGSNEWGDAAFTWLANRHASKIFDNADKALKGLVEFDVSEATGYGVRVSRAKNGALTVREFES